MTIVLHSSSSSAFGNSGGPSIGQRGLRHKRVEVHQRGVVPKACSITLSSEILSYMFAAQVKPQVAKMGLIRNSMATQLLQGLSAEHYQHEQHSITN